MIAKIESGLNVVVLPDDLIWINKHNGTRLAIYKARAINGATIVRRRILTSDYPITLQSGDDFGLIGLDSVEKLKSMYMDYANGANVALTIDGIYYNVGFESGGLTITPLLHYCEDQQGDFSF